MAYERARTPHGALEQLEADRQAASTVERALPLSEALSALQAHPWRFASTMKDTPHEYTKVDQWDADEFYGAVAAIRVHGTFRYFRGWPYLELDGPQHTYWTMGYPVGETTIINRRDR